MPVVDVFDADDAGLLGSGAGPKREGLPRGLAEAGQTMRPAASLADPFILVQHARPSLCGLWRRSRTALQRPIFRCTAPECSAAS